MDNDAKRIVDVVITRESSGLTSANFSTPLFLSATTAVATTVQTFTSPKGVLDGGFTETSAEYYASVAHFSQTNCPAEFKIAVGKTATAITLVLGEIVALDNAWYGLTISDITDTTDITDAGTWCNLNDKFLFAGSADVAVLGGTESTTAPSKLNTASIKNSMCFYNSHLRVSGKKSAGYADVAFASMVLGRTVGSYTPFGKTLTGMEVDKFNDTQITNMRTKNVTWYNNIYGKNITEGVRTCGGTESDWIDIEIGIDWLSTRLQERVLTLILNSEKIPYTTQGVALLQDPIDSTLDQAVRQGLLANYVVFAEDPALQTPEDRAGRVYNGLSFEATLAGAIHKTKIKGKVRV